MAFVFITSSPGGGKGGGIVRLPRVLLPMSLGEGLGSIIFRPPTATEPNRALNIPLDTLFNAHCNCMIGFAIGSWTAVQSGHKVGTDNTGMAEIARGRI